MSYDTNATLTLNNDPYPQQPQPTSSSLDAKQISKLILRSALQKANEAVQFDSTNNVTGAIQAYKEAITLLERVLATVEKENDRSRLQEIHDSYSERIRLLSTITSPMEDDLVQHEQDDSSWLNSKPMMRTSSKSPPAPHMLRKMTSTSSMDSTVVGNQRTPWQDSVLLNRLDSKPNQQKEAKIPVSSPSVIQLQTSKSTPTVKSGGVRYEQEFDLDKDELNLLGQHEQIHPMIKRPPRNSSRIIKKPVSSRSSISSITTTSSIESSTSIAEQPSMALPSLKSKNNIQDTPLPSKKSNFRARTSSLPKTPVMHRSTSMSTVDPSLFPDHMHDDEEELMENETIPVIEKSTPLPPPLIIHRPLVSRPSVGNSLGSMRKKAANRLSMEGLIRNKNTTPTGTSTSGPIYGLFLKDQVETNDAYDILDDMDNQGHLRLLFAIEKSMLEGAHITQRLYIPKNLWQQPNIRLSSMDIKISACESLLNDISRLEQWSYLDDLVSSSRLLETFENAVDILQFSLAKKLKRESHVENSSNSGVASSASSVTGSLSGSSMHHSHSRDSMSTVGRTDSGKKTQSFMSWGTKFTKSVERMNAFSLTKTNTEDQYKHYIEVLQKLLSKIHTLETWLHHYNTEKKKSRQTQYDLLIMKLVKICTIINNVIGGFLIKDITILLAKWLKRGGSWVNE